MIHGTEKINILLVDDRPANLLALAAILDQDDYHLVLAHSGREALGAIREREFAAILMDVQMPDIDGFETARRIRALPDGRGTPIIFVTANYRETNFVQDGYAAGGVDYLFKPLDTDIVRSKVGVFVDLYLKNKTLRMLQERTARLVAVQRITTDLLAGAAERDAVLPEVLREICRTLTWDVGTFWDLGSGGNVLRCKHFWSDPACPASFISASVGEVFAPGVGLPGRVWLGGRSLWAKEGLGSAVAFPIPVDGQVTGVMEFFSRSPQQEDLDLLKIMTAVGNQIGQFVARVEALKTAQEAVRARDEFISVASHELKTPLTVLRIQTLLNRRKLEKKDPTLFTPGTIDKFIKVGVSQVERMIHLVENMLDVSRISNGPFPISRASLNLSQMVEGVVEGFVDQAEAKGCRLLVDAEPEVTGNWDRFRLEQVVTNLITNAIKYGSSGQLIEVSVRSTGDHAKIAVRDHGPGIAPENRDKIFDRFERPGAGESVGGLGLGLYISRQIARAHNGDLHVESEQGKGATFIVDLPITAPVQLAAESR